MFNFFVVVTLGGGSKKDLAVIYVREEMEKEDVVQIYNGILLSPKKEHVDHDGYSISSKGFLPTVLDIMVI